MNQPDTAIAGVEAVVVLAAVAFQEEAQVQQRALQHAALHEQQRDQQTPDTAVAVEERVDRLELSVRQSDERQRRLEPAVQEYLQVPDRVWQAIGWRRHERSVLVSATSSGGAAICAPTSLASTSSRLDCVPSIWELSTASRRT